MKHKQTLLIVALISILLFNSGCKTQPVPSNHIKGSFGGQPFEIQNPQQFAGTNMQLTVNVGSNSLSLHFDAFKSENDAGVINESFAGQIALEKTRWDGINTTIKNGISAGVRALAK